MEHHSEYRAGLARRAETEAAARRRRRTTAEATLPALHRLLVSSFGAERVVLIGSLARGELDLHSDIDLVAWGIPPERFYEAGAALERAADPFPVDLIPGEAASPELRLILETEGRLLGSHPPHG